MGFFPKKKWLCDWPQQIATIVIDVLSLNIHLPSMYFELCFLCFEKRKSNFYYYVFFSRKIFSSNRLFGLACEIKMLYIRIRSLQLTLVFGITLMKGNDEYKISITDRNNELRPLNSFF